MTRIKVRTPTNTVHNTSVVAERGWASSRALSRLKPTS
jgi:hypothetical protein